MATLPSRVATSLKCSNIWRCICACQVDTSQNVQLEWFRCDSSHCFLSCVFFPGISRLKFPVVTTATILPLLSYKICVCLCNAYIFVCGSSSSYFHHSKNLFDLFRKLVSRENPFFYGLTVASASQQHMTGKLNSITMEMENIFTKWNIITHHKPIQENLYMWLNTTTWLLHGTQTYCIFKFNDKSTAA